MKKNIFIKYSGIFLLLTISAFSSKRAAVIIVLLIIILEITKNVTKNRNYREVFLKYFKLSAGLVLLSFSIYLSIRVLNSVVIAKLMSVVEDGGSGRTDILSVLFLKIRHNTFAETLFGHGVSSTNQYTNGLSAHNDFVEVFFNFGLVGFVIYLIFWILLVKKFFALKKEKSSDAFVYFISIIIFLIISLFSNLIYIPTYLLFLLVFWNMVWNRKRDKGGYV